MKKETADEIRKIVKEENEALVTCPACKTVGTWLRGKCGNCGAQMKNGRLVVPKTKPGESDEEDEFDL